MDVTDEAAAANAVMAAVDVFGSLDVVHQQCGIWQSFVRETLTVGIPGSDRNDLFVTIIVTKAALRYFAKRKQASPSVFLGEAKDWPSGSWPIRRRSGRVEGFSEGAFRATECTARHQVTIVNPVAFARLRGQFHPISEGHPEYDRRWSSARFQRKLQRQASWLTPKRQLRRSQLTQEQNPPFATCSAAMRHARETNDLARSRGDELGRNSASPPTFETK